MLGVFSRGSGRTQRFAMLAEGMGLEAALFHHFAVFQKGKASCQTGEIVHPVRRIIIQEPFHPVLIREPVRFTECRSSLPCAVANSRLPLGSSGTRRIAIYKTDCVGGVGIEATVCTPSIVIRDFSAGEDDRRFRG